jgi:hypothetical protein
MADPKETWSPGEKTLKYVVELEGAKVALTRNTFTGPSVTEYAVERVEVTTRWTVGQEEEGRTFVKLEVREVIGNRLSYRPGTLYPDDLDEVPPWLTALETRASPRDVG